MQGAAAADGRDARSRAALWANGIEHLTQFTAEHGHMRVPAGFVCGDGMQLSAWVNKRRAERRAGAPTLTAERIAQLDALGFVWDPPRGRIDEYAQQWAVGLAQLEHYVDEHGHARVPNAWVSEAGFGLGRWVSNRRRNRRYSARALTPERIAQLDALGFDWGTTDTPVGLPTLWAAGIDHLTEFIAEHGHARVPTSWTSRDGFQLGAWVMNRRADRRIGRPTLTVERISTLDALGFDWGTYRRPADGSGNQPDQRQPRRSRWDIAVEHLETFIAEHDHARVPQKWVSPDGFTLGAWVTRRRYHRRTGNAALTPERIAQLDALGFEWEPPRGPRRT